MLEIHEWPADPVEESPDAGPGVGPDAGLDAGSYVELGAEELGVGLGVETDVFDAPGEIGEIAVAQLVQLPPLVVAAELSIASGRKLC